MNTDIIGAIDKIANKLESMNLLKEAYDLDVISNTIEKIALDQYYNMSLTDLSKAIKYDVSARLFLLNNFKKTLEYIFEKYFNKPLMEIFNKGKYTNKNEILSDIIQDISQIRGKFWEEFSDFITEKGYTDDQLKTYIPNLMRKMMSFKNVLIDFYRRYNKEYSKEVPFDHQGLLSKEILTESNPQEVISIINESLSKDPEGKKAILYWLVPQVGDARFLLNTGITEEEIRNIENISIKTGHSVLTEADVGNLMGISNRDARNLLKRAKRKIKEYLSRKEIKREDLKEDFPEQWQRGQKPISEEIPFKEASGSILRYLASIEL